MIAIDAIVLGGRVHRNPYAYLVATERRATTRLA